MEERNKDVVRQYTQRVWSNGEVALLNELVAPDFVRHCEVTPELQVRNREQLEQLVKGMRAAFPDYKETTELLLADDDKVAFYIRAEGTQRAALGPFPPTGKKMELHASGVHRLAAGKIVESWVTWDNLRMMVQLGHLQPPGPPPGAGVPAPAGPAPSGSGPASGK